MGARVWGLFSEREDHKLLRDYSHVKDQNPLEDLIAPFPFPIKPAHQTDLEKQHICTHTAFQLEFLLHSLSCL